MPFSSNASCLSASDAGKNLAIFLVSNAEAFIEAAALLGGSPAARRTARLLEDVLDASDLSRRLRREIIGLHRLLSLQFVDDHASLEAVCFAEIDPASPVVEEICLLTDALRSKLSALAEFEAGEPIWEEFLNAA